MFFFMLTVCAEKTQLKMIIFLVILFVFYVLKIQHTMQKRNEGDRKQVPLTCGALAPPTGRTHKQSAALKTKNIM